MGLFNRILFVGAHADDVELFAGGTLAKFADNARVLVFSLHRGVRPAPVEEFNSSMELLGVIPARRTIHDLPACQDPPESFGNYHSWMYKELVRMARVYQPTLVVTHQSTDTNQDHKFVHALVLRVFKNWCSIICGEFGYNDLPRASRTLMMEISSDCLFKKLNALDCYQSQRFGNGRPYFNRNRIISTATAHGNSCRSEFAEAFEVIQLFL